MKYSSGSITKLSYGSYLAAALAYLMLKQQDAVSLTLFDDRVRDFLPPSAKKSHLNQLLGALEKVQAGAETRIAPQLHELAEKLKKRGLIVLISDLLDEPDEVINALKHSWTGRSLNFPLIARPVLWIWKPPGISTPNPGIFRKLIRG